MPVVKLRVSARCPSPAQACAAGLACGVRSPGCKPKKSPFHPGITGEGEGRAGERE